MLFANFLLLPENNGGEDTPGQIYVVRIDREGEVVWSNFYQSDVTILDATKIDEENYTILECHSRDGALPIQQDFNLLWIDGDGDMLNLSEPIETPSKMAYGKLVQCPGGGFAISSTRNDSTGARREVMLIRTDDSGNEVYRSFYNTGFEQYQDPSIRALPDSSFIIWGEAFNNPDGEGTRTYLLKLRKEEWLSVDDSITLQPESFRVDTAYPNPFNSSVRVGYALPKASKVIVTVHDITGRLVETLFDGYTPAGSHMVNWVATNSPAGLYFCRVAANGKVGTTTLLLMK